MTSNQVRDFIAKYPTALNYVKPSHLEEMNPLLEVTVEAVVVSKAEFHDLRGTFAPKKETLDRFAAAAGIQFNQVAETTRREGDSCYVGTAQAYVLGPDGKAQNGPICEYEFDVDVRLEEMRLNKKTEWVNGQKSAREYQERELQQERIQLMKVARARANTGARSRAIVAVLGMQTGFKDLFQKGTPPTASVVFIFSRIIWNAKNRMVMDAMIDSLKGSTLALYGPAKAQDALPEPAMRPVTEAPAGDYDPFAEPPVEDFQQATAVPALSQDVINLQQALAEWLNVEIPTKARDAIQDAFNRGEADPIVLRDLLSRTKAAAEKLAAWKAENGK